jgi:hypothetical protein
MPTTNFFFNNFQSSQEQLLLENLIIESVKIYGQEVLYIPRTINNFDKLHDEDDQSSYDQAIPIEMYIKSIDGFSGDGEFLSKFGVEIRNQVVFSVARRRFSEEVGDVTTQVRPNEGDIIYFPLNNRVFQIRFVNNYEMFYQLGTLQTWDMTCEMFEYSGEVFNTGIPAIDDIQYLNSLNVFDWTIQTETPQDITDEAGNYFILEGSDAVDKDFVDDEKDINEEGTTFKGWQFIDFSESDPFGDSGI